METADSNGARLVIANDPDSDRLAVAEKQSKYFELLGLHISHPVSVEHGRYSMVMR
jgi:hypothetical protein